MIAVILAVVLTLISALPVYCQSLRPASKEGVHPRVHGMLSRLERETLTKGPFHGDMFARQRGIRTAGQDDVTVFLYADPGQSAESIDTAGLRL
ncbi:MAG TPA: hypothetical protein VN260_10610, partial [Dissulfurispiraceae bacterium]|nr:hypothetical protein [Dissulfurispiraceae bacterium]